ncbi:hypothetical protein W97_05951 [Coniosporium apollinis CBS 100218]|uniref:Uncharacterized protein n=1 Tax=Coniosporium apollinis (strain CBS 100218) TaxID=1168221 RepID=R7YXN9_CONA1|nr:uncharacterized protein W97_05951 [Coniosporium apollinis CBS 100218]EON66705.1 hypothetical protein W97_05951 [Coniosporium apollinis CBS 100218]
MPSTQLDDATAAQQLKRKRREATVYDAVAGRVGPNGFLDLPPAKAKDRNTASSSTLPIPPEEALFKRKDAPARYEENDIYFASRYLESNQILPDSDLLKAMHAYASDYYSEAPATTAAKDFKSLDETSLLAMGILMEEAAAAALDETGDLALVGSGDEDRVDRTRYWNGTAWARSVVNRQPNQHTVQITHASAHEKSQKRRSTRKRKRAESNTAASVASPTELQASSGSVSDMDSGGG